ncbi:calcium-dependent phosphotriesterase [Schizophyllum commune H4-8]|uniref:calcium-dependent phosphotriesterase n=1 Tax=Schizophyllum commune (strain H4-8 / FGSC 9210) TaxID=578458 RepID=UPI0021608E43|nr:calcium-dependent phosphotriesterase [Schizophyllum commune H4-8]KAI5885613.1 calcium-dependent phosphotriesterase [Schizophyllum commune H4-8]
MSLQVIDPLTYAVLGPNATFRPDAFSTPFFNPTNATPPCIQVFDDAFYDILGDSPLLALVAESNLTTEAGVPKALAHEAPVWIAATDEVFFASAAGEEGEDEDGWPRNNRVSKISMQDVERAAGAGIADAEIVDLPIPETLQNTNGGTGLYFGDILLATSGRGELPPSLVRVNPASPYNTTVILDNFFGRQFNSLNDVKVHPKTGKILFTDVTYGFLTGFRPEPQMPNQVYVLDPATGSVRVIADGFVRCNGIALTPDGETAYVTDTGAGGGIWGTNSTLPATIYAYDVHPRTHALTNRRVFAYTDAGIADGIQVDADGNVYAGCGDGTQVWDQDGTLLGKFFLGTTSANMAFAGDGRLVILAEQKVYYAKIAARAGVVEYPLKE